MAYKKYQHVPLYLEWAPRDVFLTAAPERPAASAKPTTAATPATPAKGSKAAKAAEAAVAPAGVGEDEDEAGGSGGSAGASVSVFVKGLAFATVDEALRRHFDKAVSAAGGTLRSAKVRAGAG